MLSAETGELAGTAHYTYELVRHLLDFRDRISGIPEIRSLKFVLFFDGRYSRDTISVLYRDRILPNVETVFLPVSRLPLLSSHFYLARALRRAKLDVFHSPAHPLPLFYRGKMIWTVHDLAIYDHPEWFPKGLRKWFATRVTVPRGMRRAVKLIAPSESTKRDIIRIFNVPEKKIVVIYEGATEINQNAKIEDQNDNAKFKNYFLFIGTIEPRKNLVRLIDAFIRFRNAEVGPLATAAAARGPTSLILAGASGWKNDDVFMAIERANVKLGKESVQYLGYVSEEEKIALLKNATAFVWPSLYEGFGLPVLEAMAVGVPVITSNVSSIPEITGDTAVLVNPENIEEIVSAIDRVVRDEALRDQLKTRGLERAKQFTWEKTARETLAVYNDCGIH